MGGDPNLPQVASTLRRSGLLLRLGQCGHEHAGQDRDDRNYDQQLNQGEPDRVAGGGGLRTIPFAQGFWAKIRHSHIASQVLMRINNCPH